MKPFLTRLDELSIPLAHCHTSGHASINDLRKLATAVSARRIVPIHSFNPDRFPEFIDNVYLAEDGQWWDVRQQRMK